MLKELKMFLNLFDFLFSRKFKYLGAIFGKNKMALIGKNV